MQVTEEMLKAAVKKAIEHGMLPRQLTTNEYLHQLQAMKDILQAALNAAQSNTYPISGKPDAIVLNQAA